MFGLQHPACAVRYASGRSFRSAIANYRRRTGPVRSRVSQRPALSSASNDRVSTLSPGQPFFPTGENFDHGHSYVFRPDPRLFTSLLDRFVD